MFKSLVISLALLGSISAQAATPSVMTIIGWGIDGATARPMPAANSGEMAAEVYAALGGTNSEVDLSADGIEIVASHSSVTVYIADQASDIQRSKNANGLVDIRLQGNSAQFLYENLQVSADSTVGATNKTAGNIRCSVGFNQNGNFYQCLLNNVNALQMPTN